MKHQNELLMRRFVDRVINQGDFNYIQEAVHPDYVYRSPEDEFQGPEALKQLLGGYRDAFPDLNLKITDMVADDQRTSFTFVLSGTHQGELMGVPATGNAVEVDGMIMSHFRDGQIISEWELIDSAALYKQLGLA